MEYYQYLLLTFMVNGKMIEDETGLADEVFNQFEKLEEFLSQVRRFNDDFQCRILATEYTGTRNINDPKFIDDVKKWEDENIFNRFLDPFMYMRRANTKCFITTQPW